MHLVLLDPRIKAHQFSFNIFNVIPFFSTSRLNAPFLYLHWAGNGFISLFSLRSKLVRYRSVIIKLADFWWVTGGCHYVGDCDGYISRQCRDCPLVLPWAKSLPHYIWKLKHSAIRLAHVNLVSPSRHLYANLAKITPQLSNLHHIPNGVELPPRRSTSFFESQCQRWHCDAWTERSRKILTL